MCIYVATDSSESVPHMCLCLLTFFFLRPRVVSYTGTPLHLNNLHVASVAFSWLPLIICSFTLCEQPCRCVEQNCTLSEQAKFRLLNVPFRERENAIVIGVSENSKAPFYWTKANESKCPFWCLWNQSPEVQLSYSSGLSAGWDKHRQEAQTPPARQSAESLLQLVLIGSEPAW